MILSKEISVIVQGAIDKKLTPKCLKSIRKHLPAAEIILSTWEGSDVLDLDYDVILLNTDPGCDVCDYIYKTKNNVNRQIISTLNGLNASKRKFAMKIRSDMVITNKNFIKFFEKFEKYRNNNCLIFEHRIVINNLYCADPEVSKYPFHISDWVQFGLRKDLINLWDIPLYNSSDSIYFENKIKPDNDRMPTILFKYIPEQYIGMNCLLKNGIRIQCEHYCDLTDENLTLTNLFFANNFIILNYNQFGIKFLKYNPYIHGIQFQMTYRKWLNLYIKYCNKKYRLPFFYNIIVCFGLESDIKKYFKHWYNFKNHITVLKMVLSDICSITYYGLRIILKIFSRGKINDQH